MGKGDARLHARTQCTHDEMQLRWQLAFGKLSHEEQAKVERKLEELDRCTTQQ